MLLDFYGYVDSSHNFWTKGIYVAIRILFP